MSASGPSTLSSVENSHCGCRVTSISTARKTLAITPKDDYGRQRPHCGQSLRAIGVGTVAVSENHGGKQLKVLGLWIAAPQPRPPLLFASGWNLGS
ncbi:hypothetical protein BHE74_00008753 [Ensete ventricosum]|uniref:Uncharacterized protein n=1 Tax=Ensete ventricosum TaxID=4639 RepID=A0A444FJ20_ENSVE|nr:hypothetical protein B296_00055425 [Ensete ventricosum]RWW22608.1 hypothetical protein GW17_00013178 [Ensete ventricosum]RWW82769.1 hypothetical protein BHE74_00008753 [Ensete ventricosum]RZS20087.1 hypothetical protein BHM03_00052565 [Ensete ventricosum]